MKKFARKCDVTNELMNQGWVVGDGEMYIKNEWDALNKAIEMGYLSIEDAYDNDAMYWTEWDEEDYLYGIDDDGNIVDLEDAIESPQLTELKTFLKHLQESKDEMLMKMETEDSLNTEFWDRMAYNISTNGKSITLYLCADTFSRMEAFIKGEIKNFEY